MSILAYSHTFKPAALRGAPHHPIMLNQPSMYHILYHIPHNVALARADRRTDGMDRQTDDAKTKGGNQHFSISYMFNTKSDHFRPKIKRYVHGNRKSHAIS